PRFAEAVTRRRGTGASTQREARHPGKRRHPVFRCIRQPRRSRGACDARCLISSQSRRLEELPMRFAILLASLLSASVTASDAATPTRIDDDAIAIAHALRDQALADDTGWKLIESLTTEVGPRLPGSEADARAVAWAKAKFAGLDYDRVWTEPVTFPKWERRSESAHVVGAHAQPLLVTALGGSPGGTVEAPIVRFADYAALEAAPAG